MRIVAPELIQREEQALIESIKSVFLYDEFCKQFNNNHQIELSGVPELNGGDLVVEQDKILFKLNIFSNIGFSILIDRQGNFIGFESSADQSNLTESADKQHMILSAPDIIRKKEEEILRAISQAIDTENVETLFEKEFNAKLTGDTLLEDGNIVINNNMLAYRLNFTAGLNINLHVDMDGNLIEIHPPDKLENQTIYGEATNNETTYPD